MLSSRLQLWIFATRSHWRALETSVGNIMLYGRGKMCISYLSVLTRCWFRLYSRGHYSLAVLAYWVWAEQGWVARGSPQCCCLIFGLLTLKLYWLRWQYGITVATTINSHVYFLIHTWGFSWSTSGKLKSPLKVCSILFLPFSSKLLITYYLDFCTSFHS